MKIVEKTVSEAFMERHDYRQMLVIEVDDEHTLRFLDGEPEDSNLSRDFSDCYNIISLMRKAYLAGKNGDDFDVEHVELDDFE